MSLPQVVAAMTILGIVMGISMMIFGNIFHGATPLKEKQLSMAIDAKINEAFKTKITEDNVYDFDGFRIETEFTEHIKSSNLKIGYFMGFIGDSDNPVVEKRILIRAIEVQ